MRNSKSLWVALSLFLPLTLGGGCASQLSLRTEPPATAPKATATQTVVFIHGMFMTPLCWEGWQRYFQERGFHTLAPAWPEHDAEPATLRQRHPSAALGALTLEQVLDSYRKLLATLPEKPVLVGHSMGGLIVQLLLAEGLGTAGVAIDSAPPKGLISLKYSFLKSNWPVLSPSAKLEEPVLLSPEQFQYAFVNGLEAESQRVAYERYVVPESRRVGKGPTTDVAKIDFAKSRPPLLLLAGGSDHIIPASLNRSNFHRYDDSPSLTEFREFPNRTHFTIGQAGWEEVAGFAADWLKKTLPQPTPAPQPTPN